MINRRVLTFLLHADLPAATQTTGLALATHPHVHLAVAAILARVRRSLRDRAPEESCNETAKE